MTQPIQNEFTNTISGLTPIGVKTRSSGITLKRTVEIPSAEATARNIHSLCFAVCPRRMLMYATIVEARNQVPISPMINCSSGPTDGYSTPKYRPPRPVIKAATTRSRPDHR